LQRFPESLTPSPFLVPRKGDSTPTLHAAPLAQRSAISGNRGLRETKVSEHQASSIWACDFFGVQTILFQTLCVLFVIQLRQEEVLRVESDTRSNSRVGRHGKSLNAGPEIDRHSDFHGHELREYPLTTILQGALRRPQYPFPIRDSGGADCIVRNRKKNQWESSNWTFSTLVHSERLI